MNRSQRRQQQKGLNPAPKTAKLKVADSIMDIMEDGREFGSLLDYQFKNMEIVPEIRRSIEEISSIRSRPLVCYVANVVKAVNGSI